MTNKKYIIISIIGILLITVGLSVAYFTVQIVGESKDITVNFVNDLKVIFTDNNSISVNNVKPGWEASKTFSVESQADTLYYYNIKIEDLLNTLETRTSLQYKIVSTKGYNTSSDDDNWLVVPNMSTATDTVIAYNIPLEVGDKHEYTIYFKYVDDPYVDQSIDMNKTFSGKVYIEQGSESTLANKILLDNNAFDESKVPERTDFDTAYYGWGCYYNGKPVIDYSKSDITNGIYTYSTQATCTETPICVFEFSNPITNITEQNCSSLEGRYINEYAVWVNKNDNPTFFKTNNAEHKDTVYYYAGNATNNWVIFGTCKDSTYNCTVGDDLYWRIIRTNEDATGGGVRLLYSGSGLKEVNGKTVIADNVKNAFIAYTPFNDYDKNSDAFGTHLDRYVGYMYGTSGYELANIRENTQSSTIKGVIDQWYNATITEKKLKERISTTAVYCNDRSYTNDNWYSSGSNYNIFGASGRLVDAKAPSYACGANTSGFGSYFTGGNDKADKFSSEETTYGNGLLTYPVALMTADEVAFAGSKVGSGSPSGWYAANKEWDSATNYHSWWLLSPDYADCYYAYVFGVYDGFYGSPLSSEDSDYYYYAVRPSLSLNSNTLASGSGTANDPYIIK